MTVCSRSQRGLNVEVKYFQLGKITIPSEVENQFIRASTLKEQNDEEKLKQKAVIVRKETNQKVKSISYTILYTVNQFIFVSDLFSRAIYFRDFRE